MPRRILFALCAGLTFACSKPERSRTAPTATPPPRLDGVDAGTREVDPGHAAIALAVGAEHTCAVREDSTVVCWGSNARGQLGAAISERCAIADLLHGQPTAEVACSAKPVVVGGLAGVTRIAAGGGTTCAIASGALSCWGANDSATVGDGTTTDRTRPTRLVLPASAVDVVISPSHACALLHTGQVACWGRSFDGEAGAGDPKDALVKAPTVIPGIADATAVRVGAAVTCAVHAAGDVSCFGALALGSDAADFRIPRRRIPALRGATAIFLGDRTHCATVAHTTSCWGASPEGPLLKGTPGGLPWSMPRPASEVGAPRALVIAYGRACAADTAGAVACWGYDGRGTSSKQPVPLAAPATSLGIGASHVCARTVDGAVWCWGGSGLGQVGRIDAVQTSPLFGTPARIVL